MLTALLSVLVTLCTFASSSRTPYHLPAYFKQGCSRNDPKLNECVVEIAKPAWNILAKGDPMYKVPPLDPRHIGEIKLSQGTQQVGLTLIIRNVTLHGFKDSKFISAKVDLDNKNAIYNLKAEKMKLEGQYTMSGQVLLLPITGKGKCEIWIEKLKFSYFYQYNLIKKKNGFTYVNITNSSFPLEVGNMKMNFQNLFNGDKLLGSNMNAFMNENWKVIAKDMIPAFANTFSAISTDVFRNIAKLVPYEYMYPEKL